MPFHIGVDLSQDENVGVLRVMLKRKSADCAWGIIICGTDETSNAPVFIDSLTPGEPGSMSGLLSPRDRILAINGNAIHAGHTLTQAMHMLQQFPDRVVLHVARRGGNPSESASAEHSATATGKMRPMDHPHAKSPQPHHQAECVEKPYHGSPRAPNTSTPEKSQSLNRKMSLKKVTSWIIDSFHIKSA